MMRVAVRRLSSLTPSPSSWRPQQAVATIGSRDLIAGGDSSSSADNVRSVDALSFVPYFYLSSRGNMVIFVDMEILPPDDVED